MWLVRQTFLTVRRPHLLSISLGAKGVHQFEISVLWDLGLAGEAKLFSMISGYSRAAYTEGNCPLIFELYVPIF